MVAMSTQTATPLAIALDQISPSPYQARKDFDPQGMKSLAQSMKEHGLLQSILVRELGKNKYELISGERRWRAAQTLGWETIEARVIKTQDEADAAAKGLTENLLRQDLNPIEEAEGFQELAQLDPTTWTQERISEVAGKDRSYVSKSLGLLKLHPVIVDMVRRHTLSRDHGVELARVGQLRSQLAIAKRIPGKLTREETRKLVDGFLSKDAKRTAKRKQPSIAQPVAGDPLGSLWASLMADPNLQGKVKWKVAYEDPERWNLNVYPLGANHLERLHAWFGQMTEALRIRLGSDAPARLAAPVVTQAMAAMDRRLHLAWEAVEGARRYEILYGADPQSLRVMATSEPIYGQTFRPQAKSYKEKVIYLAVRAVSDHLGPGLPSDIKKIEFLD